MKSNETIKVKKDVYKKYHHFQVPQEIEKSESKILETVTATPFIKWAGGKTKLLPTIEEKLPSNLQHIKVYIEPFVGAGSVFLHMVQNHDFDRIIINDVNSALMAIYKNIRDYVEELMIELDNLQEEYLKLPAVNQTEDKKNYYLNIRDLYNKESRLTIIGSARFIFLNKYGFNGLYRENKKGENNVGFGKKEETALYDKFNLLKINQILNQKNYFNEFKVIILNGDYKNTLNYSPSTRTFVYMDPPYRPVTTSGFTNYHKTDFNDNAQVELREFCKMLDHNNAYFMLSNSDPRVQEGAKDPNFFDNLYDGCNIDRVYMRRNINSKATGRGAITELLIRNYNNDNKWYFVN